MRPLLAIETSGSSLGVALHTDQGIAFERNVTAGAVHGRALAPLIDECLKDKGLAVADLEAVAVSVGPGSWTGLRIGITAAKTLAWSAGVGLVMVPSFEALALQAAKPGHAVLTLRDARSEGFFSALFPETFTHAERWIPECVLKRDEAVATFDAAIKTHPGSTLLLCGDGVCMDALAAAAAERSWIVERGHEHISGGSLAAAGWRRLQAGQVLRDAADIHKAAPLYLRASDPELKLKARTPAPA